MAQYANIDGTSMEIKGGKTNIDGSIYDIKQGKTNIDGSIYPINFSSSAKIQVTASATDSTGYGYYYIPGGNWVGFYDTNGNPVQIDPVVGSTIVQEDVPYGTEILTQIYFLSVNGQSPVNGYSFYINGVNVTNDSNYIYRFGGSTLQALQCHFLCPEVELIKIHFDRNRSMMEDWWSGSGGYILLDSLRVDINY